VLVHDDLSGLMAGGGQPSRLAQVSLARPVASQFLSEVSGLPGHFPRDRGAESIEVLDLRPPWRAEPRP